MTQKKKIRIDSKKVHSDGALCQGVSSKLTKAEQEVLSYLTIDYLTPQKIAIRRKTKPRIVYKLIENLKKKGAINEGAQMVHKFDGTCAPSPENGIRLHAEMWQITILHKDERYKDLEGKSITIDGNTVRLHKETIVIYSNQSFFGSDTWAATAKSVEYWNSFFNKLEWQFKIILTKPRAQNTERVRAEYAHIKNGLSVQCHKEAEKIRIRNREDGKIWFEIDNSFNLHEAETKHPSTAQQDMQSVVEPFFNDLRDQKPPKLSDVYNLAYLNLRCTHEIGQEVKIIAEEIKSVVIIIKAQSEALIPKVSTEKEEKPNYFG